jgi:CRP/FNR family cyclic AMP-dependent transcriptional regulator
VKTVQFKSGDVVFFEGEKSQEAYRIISGRVEITIRGRSKPIILAQLSEGDIFGEMAMVDERPRSATARCVESAECEMMGPADFQRAILQDPHRLLPYLSAFFERLRTVNDRLHLELRLRAESRAEAVAKTMSAPLPTVQIAPPAPPVEHHPERIRTNVPVQTVPPAIEESEEIDHSIAMSPLTPVCSSKFDGEQPLWKIGKFPFRIGRRGIGEDGDRHSIFSSNDLLIADEEPFQISRSHCSIEREGQNFFVRDRGSTLGTIVNGMPIGVQHSCLTADLRQGENILIIGSSRSTYQFKIELD